MSLWLGPKDNKPVWNVSFCVSGLPAQSWVLKGELSALRGKWIKQTWFCPQRSMVSAEDGHAGTEYLLKGGLWGVPLPGKMWSLPSWGGYWNYPDFFRGKLLSESLWMSQRNNIMNIHPTDFSTVAHSGQTLFISMVKLLLERHEWGNAKFKLRSLPIRSNPTGDMRPWTKW